MCNFYFFTIWYNTDTDKTIPIRYVTKPLKISLFSFWPFGILSIQYKSIQGPYFSKWYKNEKQNMHLIKLVLWYRYDRILSIRCTSLLMRDILTISRLTQRGFWLSRLIQRGFWQSRLTQRRFWLSRLIQRGFWLGLSRGDSDYLGLSRGDSKYLGLSRGDSDSRCTHRILTILAYPGYSDCIQAC